MTKEPTALERAKEIIESYCPPEAKGGAYINSKMLTEDIAEALTAAEARGIERAAKYLDSRGVDDLIACDAAQAVRKLKSA